MQGGRLMLKRVGNRELSGKTEIFIKEASFPVPFQSGLEFNSPVHGNWNIVHTGMLVPEARQIYVCADNCMRGVVLTAAEMNAADRFSFVIVEEKDLLGGNLEDVTIEGVTDILNRLDEKPKAVLLFTVCLHHFLGSDLDRIYGELEERFPEIFFMRCFMDPVMQKTGPTPDQKLRRAMYDAVPERKADPECVTVLGSDFVLDESADICRILKKNGIRLREAPACKTWEDYQSLGEGSLILNCYPAGKFGVQQQAERLGRPFLYLPGSFDYEEIETQEKYLLELLDQQSGGKNGLDIETEIQKCEEALFHAHQIIGDTPVAVDYRFSSKTSGTCKASPYAWISGTVRFSGQYQPGRKRSIFLAEGELPGTHVDFDCPPGDESAATAAFRKNPCRRTKSSLVYRKSEFCQYGTGWRALGL